MSVHINSKERYSNADKARGGETIQVHKRGKLQIELETQALTFK